MFVYNIFEREEEKIIWENKGRKNFLDEVTGPSSMPVSGGGVPYKTRQITGNQPVLKWIQFILYV